MSRHSYQDEPNYVYHAWSAGDEPVLLYVGLTCNPFARLLEHSCTSTWYAEMADVDILEYPNRRTAASMEAWFINKEKPLHNRHIPRLTGVFIEPDHWDSFDKESIVTVAV